LSEEVVVEGEGDSTNELKVHIQSEAEFNSFVDEPKKLLYSTDLFKSLSFEAELVKTKAMGVLLRNVMKTFLPDLEQVFTLYDKLRYVNLDLKFASAATLPTKLRETAATTATRSGDCLKFVQLG